MEANAIEKSELQNYVHELTSNNIYSFVFLIIPVAMYGCIAVAAAFGVPFMGEHVSVVGIAQCSKMHLR